MRIAVAEPLSCDVADHLGHAGAAVGLRELGVSGQRIDDVAGEMRTVGRSQRRSLLALEIVVQDNFTAVAGNNEVDARALIVAGKEQMRIRNYNSVGGRMARYGATLDMRTVVSTQSVRGDIAEFSGQAQTAPPLWLNLSQYQLSRLAYHRIVLSKPSIACASHGAPGRSRLGFPETFQTRQVFDAEEATIAG